MLAFHRSKSLSALRNDMSSSFWAFCYHRMIRVFSFTVNYIKVINHFLPFRIEVQITWRRGFEKRKDTKVPRLAILKTSSTVMRKNGSVVICGFLLFVDQYSNKCKSEAVDENI